MTGPKPRPLPEPAESDDPRVQRVCKFVANEVRTGRKAKVISMDGNAIVVAPDGCVSCGEWPVRRGIMVGPFKVCSDCCDNINAMEDL